MMPTTGNGSVIPSRYASSRSLKRKRGSPFFSRFIYILFYVFAAYLVIPLIDIPVIGLSLSAPIFLIIALNAFLNPKAPWFKEYSKWIIFAVLIWSGIFISTYANGLLSSGVEIEQRGILTVIRYIYWLIVFIVTAYIASRHIIMQRITLVLGWSVFALALLRWTELFIQFEPGSESATALMTQNGYGFLFSTFSPFLLIQLNQRKKRNQLLAAVSNLILWGAMGINGSRGSWVAAAIGLTLCLALLAMSRPRRFIGFFILTVILIGLAVGAWNAFPGLSGPILERFNTFQNFEDDKSIAIRELMIQKAWRLFKESPIIGVGASRFTQSSTPLDIPRILSYGSQEYFDTKSSHNSYLNFLAEYGLLGSIPFALLIVTLAISGYKSAVYFASRDSYSVLAVFLSFIQMSIHMWVIAALNNTGNWFIYGLAAATVMLFQKSKREKCA